MLDVLIRHELLSLLEYFLASEKCGKLLQCCYYGRTSEAVQHIIECREVLVLDELPYAFLILVGGLELAHKLLEYADMSEFKGELHAERAKRINCCGDHLKISHFELRAYKLDTCLNYLIAPSLQGGLGSVHRLYITQLQGKICIPQTCCNYPCDRHCIVWAHYKKPALAVCQLIQILLRKIA